MLLANIGITVVNVLLLLGCVKLYTEYFKDQRIQRRKEADR